MAYADYTFYRDIYGGDILPESEAERWLCRGSDTADALTRGRLTFAFPVVPAHIVRVQKAVCALAEALYQIDTEQKAAAAQKTEDGGYRGAVASVSSGRESISYGSAGSGRTSYATAAADSAERQALLCAVATEYLSEIPDANGVNLLYAGVG